MIVTTLPIAYKANRPHRVMVSSYAVSLLAKMTGAKAYFPINMMSLRGDEWGSVAEGIGSYKCTLQSLGYVRPEDVVLSDASPELILYAQQCVEKAVDGGVCEYRSAGISVCRCGRVEILTHLIGNLADSNQLRLVTEKDGRYFCNICKSELQDRQSETLMYQQGELTRPPVWPPIRAKPLDGIVGALEKKTYLVSRVMSVRKYKADISRDLCLDPDFQTAIYLRYLSEVEEDTEVVVLVSANHLYRGSRAIATANSLGLPIHFRLVVHPMFDFAAGNTVFEQRMSSAEYLHLLGDATALKLFQATMLQWGRTESYCNVGDLPLLKKTIPSLIQYAEAGPVSLDEALELLNRNRLLAVLKKIRKNKELSEQEKCLIASML